MNICGELPQVGTKAPDFRLVSGDLEDLSLGDTSGRVRILSIVPSLDTSVCAESAVRFNKEVEGLEGVVVMNISRDLPFATKRFCSAQNTDKIVALSDIRRVGGSFGESYGLEITSGPMEGLLARAVVVVDSKGEIAYTQLVNEITSHPDYDGALEAVSRLTRR